MASEIGGVLFGTICGKDDGKYISECILMLEIKASDRINFFIQHHIVTAEDIILNVKGKVYTQDMFGRD